MGFVLSGMSCCGYCYTSINNLSISVDLEGLIVEWERFVVTLRTVIGLVLVLVVVDLRCVDFHEFK